MGRPRRYLTTAQFAEYTGASPRAINAATKPGKELSDVRRKSDNKIDVMHPQAVAWRDKYVGMGKGVPLDRVGPGPRNGRPPRNPSAAPMHDAGADFIETLPPKVRDCLDWTLRDIIEKCGTWVAFKDLLQATKTIEEIQSKRLDSDKKSGELIEREYVRQHVLSLIESLSMRLLSDLPPTLAIRVHASAASGATIEDLQALIRQALEREVKGAKKKTRERIRDAQ